MQNCSVSFGLLVCFALTLMGLLRVWCLFWCLFYSSFVCVCVHRCECVGALAWSMSLTNRHAQSHYPPIWRARTGFSTTAIEADTCCDVGTHIAAYHWIIDVCGHRMKGYWQPRLKSAKCVPKKRCVHTIDASQLHYHISRFTVSHIYRGKARHAAKKQPERPSYCQEQCTLQSSRVFSLGAKLPQNGTAWPHLVFQIIGFTMSSLMFHLWLHLYTHLFAKAFICFGLQGPAQSAVTNLQKSYSAWMDPGRMSRSISCFAKQIAAWMENCRQLMAASRFSKRTDLCDERLFLTILDVLCKQWVCSKLEVFKRRKLTEVFSQKCFLTYVQLCHLLFFYLKCLFSLLT